MSGKGRSDPFTCTHSGLLDVPHQERRGSNNPLEVLAVSGLVEKLARRHVGDGLEGALLDLGSDFLAGFAVARLEPLRPHLLEGVILRPTEPSAVAIGAQ